ncbi:CxxH/CxxC protein [Brevibacillus sp. GCM10020057]|uniref:CxxH/CxxC protein n=1 Tax=Brevibacillus sp. GCM10020057 TaxID=3317327 RepID=UPI00362FC1BB
MEQKLDQGLEVKLDRVNIEGKDVLLDPGFPVRFACMEHVEEELDDYVNDFEAAPDTHQAELLDADGLDKRCRACGAPAKIALLKEKGL